MKTKIKESESDIEVRTNCLRTNRTQEMARVDTSHEKGAWIQEVRTTNWPRNERAAILHAQTSTRKGYALEILSTTPSDAGIQAAYLRGVAVCLMRLPQIAPSEVLYLHLGRAAVGRLATLCSACPSPACAGIQSWFEC